MNNDPKIVSAQLLKLVNKAMDKKIYGSVEIYFEAGKITQVTQRIINKIAPKTKKPETVVKSTKNQPADLINFQ